MKYYIQRQLHEYGPYTLADLQRYVAQGSILLTDLTRSEGMTDWVAVSQVMGNIPVPVVPAPAQSPASTASGANVYGGAGTATAGSGMTYGGVPSYGGGQTMGGLSSFPAPVDFHWALVLLLSVVTCGLFSWAWLFVEAAFVRKINRDSKGPLFVLLSFAGVFIGSFIAGVSEAINRGEGNTVSGLLWLGSLILYFVGLFQMQSDLEDHYNTDEPINLKLNGVMTFFFGVFYLQHHLSRIGEWKRTGLLRPQGS
jgi:hypothetical protein